MPNVYVFNMLGETIQAFAPNGFTAGQIARWAGPDTEAPYTPAQLIVPLVDASDDEALKHGRFAYGENHVLFRTGSTYNFAINFAQPVGSADDENGNGGNGEEEARNDLLLYVSPDKWLLYHADGKLKGRIADEGKVKKEKASKDGKQDKKAA